MQLASWLHLIQFLGQYEHGPLALDTQEVVCMPWKSQDICHCSVQPVLLPITTKSYKINIKSWDHFNTSSLIVNCCFDFNFHLPLGSGDREEDLPLRCCPNITVIVDWALQTNSLPSTSWMKLLLRRLVLSNCSDDYTLY